MALSWITDKSSIGFCQKLQLRDKGRKHWLIVADNQEALSEVAAQLIVVAVDWNPQCVLALPTGRTPLGMYKYLVAAHRRRDLDLADVRVFNLDEFLGIAPDHPASYGSYLHRHFLSHVNMLAENVHLLDGSLRNPAAACRQYEEEIREAGGLDLAVLGVGDNGHIAFNEPGSRFDSRTRPVELTPETVAQSACGSLERPRRALTMGVATIIEARMIVLMASGEEKSDIVARALTGEVTPSLPASVLQRHPNLTVILDRPAATALLDVLPTPTKADRPQDHPAAAQT